MFTITIEENGKTETVCCEIAEEQSAFMAKRGYTTYLAEWKGIQKSFYRYNESDDKLIPAKEALDRIIHCPEFWEGKENE